MSNNAEQYTVKTPEKFTIVGITETTILNEEGQVIFDASCLEHTGLTDWKYSKKITALFASVPELIKENERLMGRETKLVEDLTEALTYHHIENIRSAVKRILSKISTKER